MKKLIALVGCVVFISFMFVGCGGNETSKLVGNWLLDDGQNFSGIVEYYSLNRDGSGIADINSEISWKIENGRFLLTFIANSIAYDLNYKFSGKNLIITVDGNDYKYTKIDDNDNGFKRWRSSVTTDPITDNKRIIFRVNSSNYESLWIRQDGGKLEMFIAWNVDLGSTREIIFRIDDRRPETKFWDISTNGQTTFYPDNPLSIIRTLLDGNQVTVRCTPQGKSPITAIFDITGLKNIATNYNDDLKWF